VTLATVVTRHLSLAALTAKSHCTLCCILTVTQAWRCAAARKQLKSLKAAALAAAAAAAALRRAQYSAAAAAVAVLLAQGVTAAAKTIRTPLLSRSALLGGRRVLISVLSLEHADYVAAARKHKHAVAAVAAAAEERVLVRVFDPVSGERLSMAVSAQELRQRLLLQRDAGHMLCLQSAAVNDAAAAGGDTGASTDCLQRQQQCSKLKWQPLRAAHAAETAAALCATEAVLAAAAASTAAAAAAAQEAVAVSATAASETAAMAREEADTTVQLCHKQWTAASAAAASAQAFSVAARERLEEPVSVLQVFTNHYCILHICI
jgi:trimeric autotransporter adhesin